MAISFLTSLINNYITIEEVASQLPSFIVYFFFHLASQSFLFESLWKIFTIVVNKKFEGLHTALVPAIEYESRRDYFPKIDFIFLNDKIITVQYFYKFLNRNYLLDKFS